MLEFHNNLGEEHVMLRDSMRKMVDREYPVEVARKIDEEDRYPREVIDKLAKMGITGILIPEEYGGMGRDTLGAYIVLEELAYRSVVLSWVFVEHTFYGVENIHALGNKAQKDFFFPKLLSGEYIFAYGLTEPDGGTDLASTKTYARREGDKFIINGAKMFISAPSVADYIILLVRTNKDVPKHKGLTILLVDLKSAGIEARPIPKLGVHGSDTCSVTFENVEVPLENVLGGPGNIDNGWKQLLFVLDVEHGQLAASSVGLARAAFDAAFKFALERQSSGQPIIKFQAINHMLAEMRTRILAAQLMTYHLAALIDAGKPCAAEGAMTKYLATQTARDVSLMAMEIHGGYGYCLEYDVSRYVKDALMLPIGGGTPQALKNIIVGDLMRKARSS
jgi:alkylation response protein AidB-like acyl-CoA dehydrogenase